MLEYHCHAAKIAQYCPYGYDSLAFYKRWQMPAGAVTEVVPSGASCGCRLLSLSGLVMVLNSMTVLLQSNSVLTTIHVLPFIAETGAGECYVLATTLLRHAVPMLPVSVFHY